ncbi:hypothetical protein CRUP_010349, partial [Coryphaenoides rupestris]
ADVDKAADQLVTDGDERRKGMREMKGTSAGNATDATTSQSLCWDHTSLLLVHHQCQVLSGVMRLTLGIPPIAVLPCLDVSGVTMALCLLTLLLMTLRGRRMAIHHRHHHLRHLPLPPPPPGPTPWPFVGNLLQMRGQQALVRQGGAFAGRPDLFTFSAVANGTSMTFSEKYGPAWTLHKKLCKQALMSLCRAEPRGSQASCLLEEHICAEAADEHIGPARVPRFADKPKMPFTEAFLYEVFRHASYVPLTIPHW